MRFIRPNNSATLTRRRLEEAICDVRKKAMLFTKETILYC